MNEELIDRLEIAAKELMDIQEDVSDDGHRDVIGWAAHYLRDAIVEIKRLNGDVSRPQGGE